MLFKKNKSISEMEAKEEAQGQHFNTNKILSIIGSYALVFGAYTTFFTWNFVPGIIVTAIMLIFAYYTIVPREIDSRYVQYGLAQRHSFMSGITQIFGEGTNKNATVITALKESRLDTYGEFRQNVESLISILGEHSGSSQTTHRAFQKIRNEYKGDIWFTNFMEQLETTNASGVINADAFHDIMKNDDQMFDNSVHFAQVRKDWKRTFFITEVCVLIAIYAVLQGFGMDNYIKIYAHAGIGWIISAIYLIYIFFTFHLMYKYNYDESITSVK